jgi:hypothetical protein
MTKEDRESLISICQVLQAIVGCQLSENRSSRALARALESRFPGVLREFERESQKADAPQSVAEYNMQQQIDGIIQRLKQSQNHE